MKIRIVLCVASMLFVAYTVRSAILIAQTGVTDQISQLVAAGGAECVVSILALFAGLFLFWKWWMSLACFLASAVWCAGVALFYLDETMWLWCLASLVLTVLTWWLARLQPVSQKTKGINQVHVV